LAALLSLIALGRQPLPVVAVTAPTLDLNGDLSGINFETTFTEDEGPKAIVSTTGLTIAYADGLTLSAAKAKLPAKPNGALESLSADPGATGLTVKYQPGKGELTIEGVRPITDYQQVLRTLTYGNTSQGPDVSDRLVEITVSDGALVSLPAVSTVLINAVNDAPVLDNSGEMTLPSIVEDEANSSGSSVNGIIQSAEQQGQNRITDVDADALEGMAIIEAVSTNGVWQYSLTAGASWLPFPAVSNTSAILLNEMSRIRFVPAPGYSGSAAFVFRAWDQSAGRQNGQTEVDVSINGGVTAFSAQTETVAIEVLPFNDLPLIDLNGVEEGVDFSPQFFEDGAAVAVADSDATLTDADHPNLQSLTATLTNRPDGAAESLAADIAGTSITAAAYDPATGRLVLTGPDTTAAFQQVLRSITYQNSSTAPNSAARVIEVVAHDGVEPGNTARSTVRVNAANTAPVLTLGGPLSLGNVAEDLPQPAGASLAALLATAGDPISDADSGALEGVAVFTADNSHGSWQFSLVNPPTGPADWQPVGVVSPTVALLLPDSAWLRFVPAANYVGPAGQFAFRAWDQTSGAAGQRVDTTQTGGNTAFSADAGVIVATMTPVNDAPILSGLPATTLSYIEDAIPLRLMPGVVVADIDSATLSSAAVRIANPSDGDAEWLVATTGSTGITAAYDEGVLQLSGMASPAAYQQVLRSVTYRDASQDPDAVARLLEVTVADGQSSSPAQTLTVQIQPVNDAPDLDLNGAGAGFDHETFFFINRTPVLIAPDLVLADQDNTTLRGATIRLVNPQDGRNELLTANVGATNIKLGSYDPITGVLSLTGMDSVANYQLVLRTITYDNDLPQPNTTDRRIEFTLNDGAGVSTPRQTLLHLLPAPTARLLMPLVSRRGEEPNDSCAEAFQLFVNRSETFLPDDAVDWFFFDLAAAAEVTVELRDFSPGRGQLNVATGQGCQQLQLIGTSGEPTADKTVSLGRREAGRYYIRVIADGTLSQTATYHLLVRVNGGS
jgi:hypothetical protein